MLAYYNPNPRDTLIPNTHSIDWENGDEVMQERLKICKSEEERQRVYQDSINQWRKDLITYGYTVES